MAVHGLRRGSRDEPACQRLMQLFHLAQSSRHVVLRMLGLKARDGRMPLLVPAGCAAREPNRDEHDRRTS